MIRLVFHFSVRKLLLRHFALPRPRCMASETIKSKLNPRTGLYQLDYYPAEPWYVKPSVWQRWVP